MTDKVCKVEPKRAIVYENGSPIVYVLPCGVRYSDKHEVHCSKFSERTCEYLVLEHITEQQEEEEQLRMKD